MNGDPPSTAGRQRIGAYAICRGHDGRVLLVRAGVATNVAGRWFLPGGGVEHGEDPICTLRREVHEETGLAVEGAKVCGVLSDTWPRPDGTTLHSVRIIYAVGATHGDLRPEAVGSSDAAGWFSAEEMDTMDLMPYVREALQRFG